eukprot:CAMPEP_0195288914 /NCGR_PEP_ID=MMETSP0707-20130614/5392_1 /TAXON_ID=33640 /ORGANISM="Asterionellopsis glacialis, Strain CCMP134" /LENGTH=387 /DNA_ID=CAMNT_0040348843 /DNA_START=257 /DNA_END=1420 /DNA_ORIENTATION=+
MLSSETASQDKSFSQSNFASREPSSLGQTSNETSYLKDQAKLCSSSPNSKSTNLARRKRGHRRLPCKARNVPEDHNVITAYFDIPADIEHGALLICSHPECARSGRRFRYCASCSIPVAKRNFLKRHSHDRPKDQLRSVGKSKLIACPLLPNDETTAKVNTEKKTRSDSSMGSEEEDDIWGSVEDALDRYLDAEEESSKEHYDTKEHQESVPISLGPFLPVSTSTSTVNSHTTKLQESLTKTAEVNPDSLKHSSKHHSKLPTAQCNNSVNKVTTIYGGPQMSMHLTPREIQWVNLLHNRPATDNTSLMHHWMESVLLLSEAQNDNATISNHSLEPSLNVSHFNHGATSKRPSIGHSSDKEDKEIFKRMRLNSLGDMSFIQEVADIFD